MSTARRRGRVPRTPALGVMVGPTHALAAARRIEVRIDNKGSAFRDGTAGRPSPARPRPAIAQLEHKLLWGRDFLARGPIGNV